jgi:hypothetical protein
MELDELGMALSVLLIAAVMDLLDVNSSHTGSRACPPCPAGPSAPVGSPHQGPTREVARRARRRPSRPPTPWRHAPWIGNRGAAVLTSVVTSCRTTTGGEQPKPTAAREARWSAQAGPASHAIGALCSTGAAIPLAAIGLLAA